MYDLFDYDGRARAFDALITSGDVSDEAINKLYDGPQPLITPDYVGLCRTQGVVLPDRIDSYLDRWDVARATMEHNSKVAYERQLRYEQFQEELRQKELGKPYEPEVKTPAKQDTSDDVTAAFLEQFLTTIHPWANGRLAEIEHMQEMYYMVNAMLHDSDLTECQRDLRAELQQLSSDYFSMLSPGWMKAVREIEMQNLNRFEARNFISNLKAQAKNLMKSYSTRLTQCQKECERISDGDRRMRYQVYEPWCEFNARACRKPILYIMKIMTGLIGTTTYYNEETNAVSIPLTYKNFFPQNMAVITPIEYALPLPVIWAVLAMDWKLSKLINCDIPEYPSYISDGSELLYKSYGLAQYAVLHDWFKPHLKIMFKDDGSFARNCRRIYESEIQLLSVCAEDQTMKEKIFNGYFHNRNLLYASHSCKDNTPYELIAKSVADMAELAVKEL